MRFFYFKIRPSMVKRDKWRHEIGHNPFKCTDCDAHLMMGSCVLSGVYNTEFSKDKSLRRYAYPDITRPPPQKKNQANTLQSNIQHLHCLPTSIHSSIPTIKLETLYKYSLYGRLIYKNGTKKSYCG